MSLVRKNKPGGFKFIASLTRPFFTPAAGLAVFFFSAQLSAATYAILPVKLENINSAQLQLTKGPEQVDSRLAPFDLSRALYLYLKAGKVRNILDPLLVESHYQKMSLSPSMGITKDQLVSLAQELDADNVLITTISGADNNFHISGSVYYRHAGIVSDEITLKGADIWELLGRYARARFIREFYEEYAGQSGMPDKPLLIAIDARGRTYPEIDGLSKSIRLLSPGKTSVVSIDGYGALKTLKETTNKERISSFIEGLSCKGHDAKDSLYPDLVFQISQNLEKQRGQNENLPEVILVVSGAPKNESSRQRVRGKLRLLARDYRIHIIGGARMPREERNFWKHTASSNITYDDIAYRIKAGLSSGHETFLFVSGSELYQGSNPELEDAARLNIGANVPSITPENAAEVYEGFSGYKVITNNKPVALWRGIIKSVFSKEEIISDEKTARIMLDIDGKPFWISVPRAQLYDPNGKLILVQDKTFYFMLYLVPGQGGELLQNDPSFALILNYNQIARYLLLGINEYLADPQHYLNRSIGASSLYIIRAKVKMVRVRPQKRY